MVSVTIIIVLSVALFIYWFRYSCLLILQTRNSASNAALSNKGLHFVDVQESLHLSSSGALLDTLHYRLNKDYELLARLMKSGEGVVDPIEQRMLQLDYRVLQFGYWATRRFAPKLAREALFEMATIIGYFAHWVAPTSAVR